MGNNGSTPLHKAAKELDISAVRVAVQQHPQLVNQKEQEFGWTALHIAAWKGSDPIARELLARGAQTDLIDKEGRTALHLCCLQGHTEVVRALLRGQASKDIRDLKGHTAYDYAAEKHHNIVALLGGPPPPDPTTGYPNPPGHLPAIPFMNQPTHQLLPQAPPAAPAIAVGGSAGTFPRIYYEQVPANAWVQPLQAAPQPGAYQGGGGYGGYDVPIQPGHMYPDIPGQSPAPAAPPTPPQYQQQPAYPQPAYQEQKPWQQPAYPSPYKTPTPQPPIPQPVPGRQPAGNDGWGAHIASVATARPVAPPPPAAPAAPPLRAHPVAPGGPSGSKAADDDDDDDWAPAEKTDWGDEPVVDQGQPHFNPIQSARFQLEKLLGIGRPANTPAPAQPTKPGSGGSASGSSGRIYKYAELASATNNFSPANKIGEGGFGPVYRGVMDGIPVAVKVMSSAAGSMQGLPEFQSEVNILSRLHHPHIVLLIGSCPEKAMLVYELMPGGSLEEHLFGSSKPPLYWQDRVRLAAEVAAALLFLHSAEEPIIHMDLKPANILLDSKLTAKLGDVGLARLAPGLAARAAGVGPAGPSTAQDSRVVGTLMYMDPEYMRSGQFSPRSDVYALGMVLLQLLTGQDEPAVVNRVAEARKNPMQFAAIIEPRAGPWPAAEACAFADLALNCVEFRRQDRPDLRSVILPTLSQLSQRTQLYPGASAPPMPSAPGMSPAAAQQVGPSAEAVSPMFICPITQDVMDDPVVAADGFTYERLAIAEWIAKSPTSPLTNMPLAHTALVENRSLRSAIQEWRDTQKRAAQRQQQARRQAADGW